jgi:hypothetical protein
MVDSLNNKDWIALIGVFLATLLEYLIKHPATAITTVIMLLITWERYRSKRYKSKHWRLKTEREEYELNTAKIKHGDWLRRAKIQDEEDKKDV